MYVISGQDCKCFETVQPKNPIQNGLLLSGSNDQATVPIHQVFFEETSFYNNETMSQTSTTSRSSSATSYEGYHNTQQKSESIITGSIYKVPRTPRILQSLSSIFLALLKVAHGPRIECTHQRFYHFEGKDINIIIFTD